MAEYLIDKAYLVALADAIRKKSGSSSKMTPSAMVSAINNLGDMTYTPQSSPTVINKTGELYTIQDTTFNSLAKAIRNKAGISDKMTPHKMIDVVNGFEQAQAFAVYSADDKSLNFYKRSEVPKTGGQFEGKTATAVYTGIETEAYGMSQWPSWSSVNNKITKVEVVDKISPISTAYWFANFYNLTSLDISKLDTSNVTDMSGMFQDCSSLTTLDVSSLNTSKVTNMDGMFKLCSSITTLDTSCFDTSRVTNMKGMFDRCTGLTTIALSGFDTALVTNMGGMFQDCSSLTTLNLSSFDTSDVTDMSGMFQDCSSLTTLDISGFCMPNIVRVMYMYDYCSKLQQVKVGEKYNWKGINGYLPVPNVSYIPGADGKWYALSDGQGYAPADIPSNKADTYYAYPPYKDLIRTGVPAMGVSSDVFVSPSKRTKYRATLDTTSSAQGRGMSVYIYDANSGSMINSVQLSITGVRTQYFELNQGNYKINAFFDCHNGYPSVFILQEITGFNFAQSIKQGGVKQYG